MNITPIIQAIELLDQAVTFTINEAERETLRRNVFSLRATLRKRGVFIGGGEEPKSADPETEADKKLAAVCVMVSRFLVAHRDVSRNWIEAFIEVDAIKVDFNYHPLYPYIEPAHGKEK